MLFFVLNKSFNLYEGITDKVDGIHHSEELTSKAFELKLNADKVGEAGVQGVRFGMVTFKKSLDRNYVDCMVSIYELEFTLAPNTVLQDNTILHELYKWSTIDDVELEKSTTKDAIAKLQNFFQYKALLEFQKAGLID